MKYFTLRAARRYRHYLFAVLLLVIAPAKAATGDSPNFNHLISADGVIEVAYQELLAQRLFPASGNLLCITVITSSATGEKRIAIRRDPKRLGMMVLAYAEAEKNLWSAAVDTKRSYLRDPAIGIRRAETALPDAAAVAILESVQRALRRTAPAAKTERVILDAELIEFSMPNEKGATARGLLDALASGKSIAALHRLVAALEAYSRGPADRRPLLLKDIRTMAEQI